MILNSIGQSFLIRSQNEKANIPAHINDDMTQKDAPILLNDIDMIKYTSKPVEWHGCLYTSKNIYDELQKQFNQLSIPVCILDANVPNKFKLGDKECEITMFPIKDKVVVFLIKDGYTTNLHTNNLGDFTIFSLSPGLREAIRAGIDVLYINDTVFQKDISATFVENHPDEELLEAFVYVVQPLKVIGTTGATIPQSIRELCKENEPHWANNSYKRQ
ncbi:uncharacterized protein LOC119672973 [Teleopsis dalmanni]|uniref:uncharacterized protein LOC119672973 n=1 Tax=Teleopsis dalmanni TaxID=139649 RepID=UPI0018CCAF06|nr:uncharacterized protein LOC119672973 [Teleopsis dalmanni]